MEEFIGKRIMVIGSPGSGKSHFSTELSYHTGLPLFHLDRSHWSGDVGKWEHDDAQRFVEWQYRTVEDDEWIFDGNYIGTLNLRLSHADTVFCFDLPRLFCLFNYLRHLLFYTLHIKQSTERRERFDSKFMKYIWNFKSAELKERLSEYPNLKVFIFRSKHAVKNFFLELDAHLDRERERRLKEMDI
jgi:adenylate kinase family enzyme